MMEWLRNPAVYLGLGLVLGMLGIENVSQALWQHILEAIAGILGAISFITGIVF